MISIWTVYSSFCLFLLIEGRLSTVQKDVVDESSLSLVDSKILTRKRKNFRSTVLDPKIYDDFGSNYIDEDNVAWSRFLKQSSYTFESCNINLNPHVTCYLSNEPTVFCEDYRKMIVNDNSKPCEAQVILEFILNNSGDNSELIRVKTAINNARPFSFIDNPEKWTFAPDHSYTTVKQLSYLNFCSSPDEILNLEVGVNCGGHSRMFYPQIRFAKDSKGKSKQKSSKGGKMYSKGKSKQMSSKGSKMYSKGKSKQKSSKGGKMYSKGKSKQMSSKGSKMDSKGGNKQTSSKGGKMYSKGKSKQMSSKGSKMDSKGK